jgi:hemoglobin-like flavoprotein
MGPSKDDLASLFFGQLLDLDPSLADLLTEDQGARDAEFNKQFSEIVDCMSNFDELVDHTRRLGEYLAARGVRVSNYPTARASLMRALEKTLGDQFDPTTRDAWGLACNLVAECMMAGASQR